MAKELKDSAANLGLISVVLPAYNEAATLAQDVAKIRQAFEASPYPFEIIVVDDGSKDKTAEVAKLLDVRLLKHETNRGVGAARKTGILEAKGEIIVTTDTDGTYPNELMPEMLKYFPDCDMVVGARVGTGPIEGGHRRIPKYLIRKLASHLSGVQIPDLNSGLRAFKKQIAQRYFSLLPNGHSWEGTITLAFLCNGHPVKFMPIGYMKRAGGKSTFRPFADTYSYVLLVVRTAMYFNPLRVLLPVSFFLLGLGTLKIIYDWLVYQYIGGLDVTIMVSALMVAILALLADLLIMTARRSPPSV